MIRVNAFVGKPDPPTDRQLREALGAAKPAWDAIADGLASEHGLKGVWKSYSIKYGWVMQLKRKERNIVHLGPCQDCFEVLLIFGEKAVAALRQSKPTKRLLKILDAAPRYPEGTGIRLEIKKLQDVAIVRELAAFKLTH